MPRISSEDRGTAFYLKFVEFMDYFEHLGYANWEKKIVDPFPGEVVDALQEASSLDRGSLPKAINLVDKQLKKHLDTRPPWWYRWFSGWQRSQNKLMELKTFLQHVQNSERQYFGMRNEEKQEEKALEAKHEQESQKEIKAINKTDNLIVNLHRENANFSTQQERDKERDIVNELDLKIHNNVEETRNLYTQKEKLNHEQPDMAAFEIQQIERAIQMLDKQYKELTCARDRVTKDMRMRVKRHSNQRMINKAKIDKLEDANRERKEKRKINSQLRQEERENLRKRHRMV